MSKQTHKQSVSLRAWRSPGLRLQENHAGLVPPAVPFLPVPVLCVPRVLGPVFPVLFPMFPTRCVSCVLYLCPMFCIPFVLCPCVLCSLCPAPCPCVVSMASVSCVPCVLCAPCPVSRVLPAADIPTTVGRQDHCKMSIKPWRGHRALNRFKYAPETSTR